jgi:hypothetical protein
VPVSRERDTPPEKFGSRLPIMLGFPKPKVAGSRPVVRFRQELALERLP